MKFKYTKIVNFRSIKEIRIDFDPSCRILVGINESGKSNPKAMQTLHHGFTGNPLRRFLPVRGATKKWFETDALPGAVIHVLGPSFDENVIKVLDPPAGESYLKLFDSSTTDEQAAPVPFGPEWRLGAGEYRRRYKRLGRGSKTRNSRR